MFKIISRKAFPTSIALLKRGMRVFQPTTHLLENPLSKVAYFDAKQYDIEAFDPIAHKHNLKIKYLNFCLTEETVDAAMGSNTVCAFVNDRLDSNVLRSLQKMGVKHLALRCAGFNNVDLEVAKLCEMTVTRVPSYSPYAVAEHTVSLLLCLNRKIHRSYNRVRELNFSLNGLTGMDLHDKQIAIIGTGKIGKITAQILKGFGSTVLAYDKHPDLEWADKHGITYHSFEDVISRGHVVSLHAPLTPETDQLIGNDEIRMMRPGVLLINTSRGKLISTRALIHGLKSGHLGGVALDVYEEEEGIFFEDLSGQGLQDDVLARLLTFPNVLVTAHQAFLTTEALTEISRVTAENIALVAQNLPPLPSTHL